MKKHLLIFQLSAIILGIITGIYSFPEAIKIAITIANMFVQFLKWLSLPMIICSILAASTKMESQTEFFYIGRKILFYTIFTTIIAASFGLLYFLILDPTIPNFNSPQLTAASQTHSGIFGLLLVSGVVFCLIFSIVLISLSKNIRIKSHNFFNYLYQKIMYLIRFVLLTMPIAIWAFVALFVNDINNLSLTNLSLYLLAILLANLTQAIIILPALLKFKRISPSFLFKGMLPALNLAFWSKSSSIALPLTMDCAKQNCKITNKVANFSLPLCTTINMNACAAFIIITVLFVASSNGITFTNLELFTWIFVATIAAIGNAGVPMGCFTLSCALVGYLGAPLYLLGIIVPFYSIIDMLESSINVWSDSCITAIVNSDLKQK